MPVFGIFISADSKQRFRWADSKQRWSGAKILEKDSQVAKKQVTSSACSILRSHQNQVTRCCSNTKSPSQVVWLTSFMRFDVRVDTNYVGQVVWCTNVNGRLRGNSNSLKMCVGSNLAVYCARYECTASLSDVTLLNAIVTGALKRCWGICYQPEKDACVIVQFFMSITQRNVVPDLTAMIECFTKFLFMPFLCMYACSFQ